MLDNLIKFLSEHGWITYSTAHEERTRREINAIYSQDKAGVQQFVNQKQDEINARVATVAPLVNVKTQDNVLYILDNQADWTAGETYTLPDADPETGEPISVVYNPTCLYIGGQIAE